MDIRHHGFTDHCSGRECGCHVMPEHYMSKKKRIEALTKYLTRLEAQAEDIREYIKELEA